MKKLIALILAIVMILSLGITASALELGEYIYLRVDLEGVEVTAAVVSFEGVEGGLHLTENKRGLFSNVYYDEALASPAVITVEYEDENGEIVRVTSETIYLEDIEGIIVLDEEGFHVENAYVVEVVDSEHNVSVTGEYAGDEETEEIISVDLAWGSMEFVYTPYVEWNPATHTYETVTDVDPIWAAAENAGTQVMVVNHSNVDISVELTFNGNETLGIEGEFFVNYDTGRSEVITGFNLPSAEGYSVEEAPFGMGFLRITGGTIPESVGADQSEIIGYVLVKIATLDAEG